MSESAEITLPVRVLRAVSAVGGVVPGWFLAVADPVFARLHGREGQARARIGTFTVDLDLSDYLQRKLYLRAFERRELRFLRRWLAAGDLAIDVGANVGVLTMTMASAVGPSGHVLAVEPVVSNVVTLRRWCLSNGVAWVEIVEAAAGSQVGTIELGLPDLGDGSASTGHYSAGHVGDLIRVPVVTVDSEVERRWSDRPVRLLKVDVEGMEPEVLRGASHLLSSGAVEAVMFEINADAADPGRAAAVLRSFGYEVRRIGWGGRLAGAARVPTRSARRGLLARNVVAVRVPRSPGLLRPED